MATTTGGKHERRVADDEPRFTTAVPPASSRRLQSAATPSRPRKQAATAQPLRPHDAVLDVLDTSVPDYPPPSFLEAISSPSPFFPASPISDTTVSLSDPTTAPSSPTISLSPTIAFPSQGSPVRSPAGVHVSPDSPTPVHRTSPASRDSDSSLEIVSMEPSQLWDADRTLGLDLAERVQRERRRHEAANTLAPSVSTRTPRPSMPYSSNPATPTTRARTCSHCGSVRPTDSEAPSHHDSDDEGDNPSVPGSPYSVLSHSQSRHLHDFIDTASAPTSPSSASPTRTAFTNMSSPWASNVTLSFFGHGHKSSQGSSPPTPSLKRKESFGVRKLFALKGKEREAQDHPIDELDSWEVVESVAENKATSDRGTPRGRASPSPAQKARPSPPPPLAFDAPVHLPPEKLPPPVSQAPSTQAPLNPGRREDDALDQEPLIAEQHVPGAFEIAAPKPPPPAPVSDPPLIGVVEIERRRVLKDGRTKLKISLLGVVVEKCGICLSQFKEGETAALGPDCQHSDTCNRHERVQPHGHRVLMISESKSDYLPLILVNSKQEMPTSALNKTVQLDWDFIAGGVSPYILRCMAALRSSARSYQMIKSPLACTCAGEDHTGPNVSRDRGAPKIDILEAERNKTGQVVSQSVQFALFNSDYMFYAQGDAWTVYSASRTRANGYRCLPRAPCPAGADVCVLQRVGARPSLMAEHRQQAASALTDVSDDMFQGLGQIFTTLDNLQDIDPATMLFPVKMLVDYVRTNETGIGCSPAAYPTAEYIAAHMDAYSNPSLTSWVGPGPASAGYSWPKNGLIPYCSGIRKDRSHGYTGDFNRCAYRLKGLWGGTTSRQSLARRRALSCARKARQLRSRGRVTSELAIVMFYFALTSRRHLSCVLGPSQAIHFQRCPKHNSTYRLVRATDRGLTPTPLRSVLPTLFQYVHESSSWFRFSHGAIHIGLAYAMCPSLGASGHVLLFMFVLTISAALSIVPLMGLGREDYVGDSARENPRKGHRKGRRKGVEKAVGKAVGKAIGKRVHVCERGPHGAGRVQGPRRAQDRHPEAERNKIGQVVSQSVQFAPFNSDYAFDAQGDACRALWELRQQAASALTDISDDMFQGLGQVFTALGKTLGKAVGKAIGKAVGKAIGKAVGKAIGKAVGKAVEKV
ncbi:predicted protein [Postia placenta Mad-698-R]|nr:predicted protein [Postia placenta Mad-698-R]